MGTSDFCCFLISQSSFKIAPKGNGDLHSPLACIFEQLSGDLYGGVPSRETIPMVPDNLIKPVPSAINLPVGKLLITVESSDNVPVCMFAIG